MRTKLSDLRHTLLRPFGTAKGFAQKGLTLIEIIIVVTLLGTLMTYLVNQITGLGDGAKEDQAKLGMGVVANALNVYRVHNNSFPTASQGLQALISNPGSSRRWRGPYIEEQKLNDPWGHEFTYEIEGRNYRLISGGLDESVGTEDDIFYPEEKAE
jgi:general secretion pathway protein G